MDAILVAIHQYQLSTFLRVINHIAVNAVDEANASAQGIAPGAIPWADGFASATAYTGMWLMARKKVESWYWWIATNIASIPLYFVKHYVFSSVYYVVLLIMAFWGLSEWQKKVKHGKA